MGARLLIGARWYGPSRRASYPSYADPPTFLEWLVTDHRYDEARRAYVTTVRAELSYARWLNFLQHKLFAAAGITNIDGT